MGHIAFGLAAFGAIDSVQHGIGIAAALGLAALLMRIQTIEAAQPVGEIRNTEQLGQKDQVQSAFHRNYNCTDTIGVKQATEWHGA